MRRLAEAGVSSTFYLDLQKDRNPKQVAWKEVQKHLSIRIELPSARTPTSSAL